MPNRRQALLGLAAASAAAPALAQSAAVRAKPAFGAFGVDAAAMDRTAAPGDDFYRYVNGGWIRSNTIPSDRARWGEFDRLRELSDQNVRAIVETAAQSRASGIEGKVGDFYAAFMDEAGIESRGVEPLKAELARIAAVSTPAQLAETIGWLGATSLADMPVNVGVGVDQKETTRYTTYMAQGGLGLPDRDYYMVEQPAFVAARAAYRKHVAAMLCMAGFSQPETRAERIYALEDRLARSHWSRIDTRDADKRYNPWLTADLPAKAPGFEWAPFLSAAGVPGRPGFIVQQPSAIVAFADIARTTPMEVWRDYLAFNLVAARAAVLPKAFADESFDFNGRVLNGTPEQPVRWKRAVAQTNSALGDAVGRLYAARHFPPEAKAKAQALIVNVRAAMDKRIRGLTWMTPATKERALAKLAALRVDVGYEDKPRDYSALQVSRSDAYGNHVRALAHEQARQLGKLSRPVDRGEWSMIAPTVNAQSNSVLVKVMFPAGILQAPFFDPAADPAVNYGGIGVVIGHEISHQFDDQGSKFDSQGRLNNWWSEADLKQFKAAGQKLIAQYDAYEPLPGFHVQGGLTLGENIGDLAGLAIAYDAYQASLKGKPAPVIAGTTGDQRFFLGYGQIWRGLQRDAALRQQLTTDPHSPGEYRVWQVRNHDAWYRAFGVKPGQKYYLPPEQRVKVW